MTTGQPTANALTVSMDEAQFGVRLKSPKILVGPLELGLAATYTLTDNEDRPTKQPLISIERFKPTLSIKVRELDQPAVTSRFTKLPMHCHASVALAEGVMQIV